MSITERQRAELYRAVEEKMGEGPADTLMAMLPPVGWADVATKHDLDQLRVATKRDLDRMREVMATKEDLQSLRTDMQSLRADFERSLREQTRTMLFGLASINLTFLGAALVGAQVLGG